MRKILIAMLAGLTLAGGAFCGDVYNIQVTAKTPVFKQQKKVYKVFGIRKFRGFINIEYNDDGTVANECPAVLYGDFPDGTGYRFVPVEVNVCNILGLKKDKVEVYFTIDEDDFGLSLCGSGGITLKTQPACGPCGVPNECTATGRIKSLTGNFTGIIHSVCDPCGGIPFAWDFNKCLADELDDNGTDILYGSWSMKYNAKATNACGDDFEDGILRYVPGKYR